VFSNLEEALKNVDSLEVLENCLVGKVNKGPLPVKQPESNNANLKKARDVRKEVKETNKEAYNQTKASVEK
jgi:hypothetical protein